MSASAVAMQHRTASRRPALERRVPMPLAAGQYERVVALLGLLSPEEWHRPTACAAWDVHAMACHILGMAELAASPLEQMRQMRAARRRGGLFIDALTAVQVEKHVHREPGDLVERLGVVTRRAARGRRLTPWPLRRMPMGEQPVDDTGLQTERWTIGYLTDVVLTRDTWIHRSDIALATDRRMGLSPEHDGVLVADVAAEWAQRHGQPCSLTLTGPAGGSWTWGVDGEPYELDAELFCRIVSGRASGDGLLMTRVPF